MKIGRLVKYYIKKIFLHCETIDHDEFQRLQDKKYSKTTFGINFPFCADSESILKNESKRYWTDLYVVRGKKVRVSSQWVISQKSQFVEYLMNKQIADKTEIESLTETEVSRNNSSRTSVRVNSRYRGNAIGNAQNLLVRNILSNLGEESFNQEDWE